MYDSVSQRGCILAWVSADVTAGVSGSLCVHHARVCESEHVCVCVCVPACARACEREYSCLHAWVRARVCVFVCGYVFVGVVRVGMVSKCVHLGPRPCKYGCSCVRVSACVHASVCGWV